MPTLTVGFVEPWWVAIVEITEAEQTVVGRYIFGAEPTNPEILQLVLHAWNELLVLASAPLAPVENPKALGNPKRRARAARKLVSDDAIGTKAQLAIKQAQAATAIQRRQQTREQREVEAEQAWQHRRAKQKAKRRGR